MLVVEVLCYVAIVVGVDLNLYLVNVEDVEIKGVRIYLEKVNGIIVLGGFGVRGIDGKIVIVEYVRINKIFFLGLCLGM